MEKRGDRESGINSIDISNNIIKELLERYNLPTDKIREILELTLQNLPKPQDSASFPVSIFSSKLTVLESVVKYLREEEDKQLSEIEPILGRNQRNLWHTYNSAQKKMPDAFKDLDYTVSIPLEIFQDEALSPSEAVVVYLKEQRQMSLHEIATLLFRDDRTVWTTYNRAKKKHGKTQ